MDTTQEYLDPSQAKFNTQQVLRYQQDHCYNYASSPPPHSNSHISVLWLIQHLHTRCSPAVQSTTISSGVSSMMSRLEMGRSVVPPSLPPTDSRSLCHFSWSSLGTSYIMLVKCGVIQNELSTSTKSLHMHWSNGELLTYILKFGIKSYAWTSPNLNIPAVYAFDKCIPT